jgi:hypothetical protein
MQVVLMSQETRSETHTAFFLSGTPAKPAEQPSRQRSCDRDVAAAAVEGSLANKKYEKNKKRPNVNANETHHQTQGERGGEKTSLELEEEVVLVGEVEQEAEADIEDGVEADEKTRMRLEFRVRQVDNAALAR